MFKKIVAQSALAVVLAGTLGAGMASANYGFNGHQDFRYRYNYYPYYYNYNNFRRFDRDDFRRFDRDDFRFGRHDRDDRRGNGFGHNNWGHNGRR